jgi:glucose-1-phosphate adenylyltransferase
MVSAGCVISGARVIRSVIFTNAVVHSHSLVEDSVILPEVDIGRNCHIRRAIIDRGTKVPDGTQIGIDLEADRARGFRVTDKQITLVTPDMLGQELHFTR